MSDKIDDWWFDRNGEPLGSGPLFNALKSAGITSIDLFLALTVHQLLAMNDIEPAAAAEALGIQVAVRLATPTMPFH